MKTQNQNATSFAASRPSSPWILRLIQSAGFWIALCGVVRLGLIAALPFHANWLRDRDWWPASGVAGGVSAIRWLDRRTDHRPLTVDEHCYEETGQNILSGCGFVLDSLFLVNTPGQPTMYAGCAYPLWIAAVYAVFGRGHELPLFLLQIALQMAAVGWVHAASRRLAGDFAATAAAFFTFHPVLIWVSLSVMTEAILIPGVALLSRLLVNPMIFRFDRGGWNLEAAGVGALLAALALTRSTTARFVAVAMGRALQVNWPNIRNGLKTASVLAAAFALVCAPWTIRNYWHWHRFIPFSTKSGVSAWFFNNPGLRVEFGRRAVEGALPIDLFDPRIQKLPDEAARNDYCQRLFYEFVKDHPARFIGLCWMRFWMALLPVRITSTTLAALISAIYAEAIPLLVLLAMIVKRGKASLGGWTRLWPLLALTLYWQALQLMAGPGLRYRMPVEPIWSILVGIGGVALLAGRNKAKPAAKDRVEHAI